MWKPGDTAVLRGIYNQHVWIAQSVVVVKNDCEEVALAMLPGAECVMPDGYINGKHGAWLNWMPDPSWSPPTLPENWDKI